MSIFGKKQPDPHSPEGNAASIDAIPATHISDGDRDAYRKRALAGEDVYAYTSGPQPVWNIWDTDTRIACAPLATSWRIVRMQDVAPQEWTVQVERDAVTQRVQFHVHLHPQHDRAGDLAAYYQRAARVIRSAVQHINLFHDDIGKLNGCQF